MFDYVPGIIVHIVKIFLLSSGIILAFCLHHAKTRAMPGLEKKLNIALGVTALFSLLAFYNFTAFHHGKIIHTHDLYHYYMGSKYFDETGYFYLYDATVIADEQTIHFFKDVKNIRDQSNYASIPKESAHDPERLSHWQPKFSAARWEEFKQDAVWFETRYFQEPDMRGNMINDFGYNGTPVWMLLGHTISNLIPTSNYWGMYLIVWLDSLLSLAMFYAIYRAFGFQVMAFSAIFWGDTFMYVYEFTGGSMLRHDWIAYLVISVCFLKKEKPCRAGFFFALATAMRLFPVMFLLPAVAVFSLRYLQNMRQRPTSPLPPAERGALLFFLSAGGFFVALVALSALLGAGDWGGWLDFISKLSTHIARHTLPWGFNDLFLWQGEIADNLPPDWREAKIARMDALWPLIWGLKITTLALMIRAARRFSYWEMICMGSAVPFMLIYLSKYYFVYLVILLPLLSWRLEQSWRLKALTILFGSMIFLFALHMVFPHATYLLPAFGFALTLYGFYLYIFIAPERAAKKALLENG